MSFASHHSVFLLGMVTCSGHACQKQPSMNTAIRRFLQPMSTRKRSLGRGRKSTRYRMPSACNSLRTAISQPVSRRFWRCMFLRTISDEAEGRLEEGRIPELDMR